LRNVPTEIATKVIVAADLIAECGLDGTKIERIAGVTGIRKATLSSTSIDRCCGAARRNQHRRDSRGGHGRR
jgi:hypothetical protein